MFARVTDLEPDMVFRVGLGPPLVFRGFDPIVSRFAGKRRGRVRVARGRSFVADWDERVVVEVGG